MSDVWSYVLRLNKAGREALFSASKKTQLPVAALLRILVDQYLAALVSRLTQREE